MTKLYISFRDETDYLPPNKTDKKFSKGDKKINVEPY